MGKPIQVDSWSHQALHEIQQLQTELHKKDSKLNKQEYEKLVEQILASLHKKLSQGTHGGHTPEEQKRDPATQAPSTPSKPHNVSGTYRLSESKVREARAGTN